MSQQHIHPHGRALEIVLTRIPGGGQSALISFLELGPTLVSSDLILQLVQVSTLAAPRRTEASLPVVEHPFLILSRDLDVLSPASEQHKRAQACPGTPTAAGHTHSRLSLWMPGPSPLCFELESSKVSYIYVTV